MPSSIDKKTNLSARVDDLVEAWNRLGKEVTKRKIVTDKTHLRASSLIQDIRGMAHLLEEHPTGVYFFR